MWISLVWGGSNMLLCFFTLELLLMQHKRELSRGKWVLIDHCVV